MELKRIAFLGAGAICSAHKQAFLEFPRRLKAVAVADPAPHAAERLAAELGAGAAPYADYRELLREHAGGLDGVLITTPHFLHAPMAAAALEHGVPVLVEKPAAVSADEMRELRQIELRSGAFLQAGQMQRFGREENWLKKWLKSSDFGEARLFNIDIYQNIEGYVSNKKDPWILDKKKAGGGITISVAVHIIDLLRFWFDDDFDEVYARGRFDAPFVHGAESTVAATLTTRGGVVGTLNASYTVARCPYSQRSLIFGTRGTLCQHMDRPGGGYSGPYYISTNGGRPSPQWEQMYSGFVPVAPACAADSRPNALHENAFTQQWLAFADSIDAGRALENSIDRNFNTVATIDAIGRSLLSGKPEPVARLKTVAQAPEAAPR